VIIRVRTVINKIVAVSLFNPIIFLSPRLFRTAGIRPARLAPSEQ
jgi:hypothetical protein